MAKKHFDEYFAKVAMQAMMVQKTLDSMKDAPEDKIPKEAIENIKIYAKPVIDTYHLLSYMKYLLDMPTRPKKRLKYNKNMKKKVASLDPTKSPESVLKTNEEVLNQITEEAKTDD